MKRIIMLLLTFSMIIGLLMGCKSESEQNSNQSSSQPSNETTAPTEDEGSEGEEQGEEAEREKITIAYHPHITGVGGILNAIDNGYFEEENLEVELVQFTSGATELAAMSSGEIDLGYLGVGAHVFAPQGQAVILSIDSTDISGEIMVRADSGIQSMKDLKGKNIAISAGTTSELVLSMALKLNDMEKTDVNMVNMDASGKVTAFMAGQIDAISIEAPYTDVIRNDMGEDAVLTISGSEDFLPDATFTNSWVTTRDYLEGNEDTVVRFLKAWIQGTEDRYNNMDESVEKVAKYINADKETVSLVVEKTYWLNAKEIRNITEDGTTIEWYKTMQDMFLDAGLLDQEYENVSVNDYYKPEYLIKAMDELDIK